MTNWILTYWQGINDGTYTVGKWTRLWYGQVVKGLEEKRFFFAPKKANAVITFAENFCRHHEGELAPGKVKLETWQKAFLSVVFGIVDENGTRQFREIVQIVGRKSGKTLEAAIIAAYCAFLDGEYGGRIYFAAPKLDQARLCFNALDQIIRKETTLSEMSEKRRTDIYVPDTNTTAQPLAFKANTSDGFNISLGVCDEISAWKGDAGLRYYEVLKSSMGSRRQPMLLSISTAGYENEGIYDELYKRCTRVLLGDSQETRLAPFLYTIDDVDKWNDINELQKANPNLGVSVSVDYMLEEIRIAEGSLSKRVEFLTKYCNIKQNSSMAWLDAQTVERCTGDHIDPAEFKNCYAVAGIDLSQTRDLTCACVVIEKDGQLYVISQFFLPTEKIDEATARDGVPYDIYIKRGLLTPSGDNYVDYHDCYDWLRGLVENCKILPLKVGYDRYSAQYLVQDLQAYGFHTDDVFQGENLWGVMEELQGIMEDGRLHIGDNDLLKIHFLDSAVKMSTERGRGRLVKVRNNVHIDGMAALLDAMTVRQKYWHEIGPQLKNEGK